MSISAGCKERNGRDRGVGGIVAGVNNGVTWAISSEQWSQAGERYLKFDNGYDEEYGCR